MPSWDLACSSALSALGAPILARLRTAQLPADLDVEALLEVIFGALFHRGDTGSGAVTRWSHAR
jgi:hypothetical protein